jgi:dihydroneopterin aldolase
MNTYILETLTIKSLTVTSEVGYSLKERRSLVRLIVFLCLKWTLKIAPLHDNLKSACKAHEMNVVLILKAFTVTLK